MQADKLKQAVFEKRPVLAKILEKHGNKKIAAYLDLSFHHLKSDAKRQNELLKVFGREAARLYGKEIALQAVSDLRKKYFASTADHHGPLCHPFFTNGNLLMGLANRNNGIKSLIVLSCANISMNNSSYPRGVFFHDKYLQKRINFFPWQNRHKSVYAMPAYAKKQIDDAFKDESGDMLSEIRAIYEDSHVLSLKDYADQISLTNHSLWKLMPGQENINLIYISQEQLVLNLLKEYHLNSQTEIHSLLFDEKYLNEFEKDFLGVQGAFGKKGKGTFLFWGINKGRRISLRRVQGKLVGNGFGLHLNPEAISDAIENKRIMPSMALSFIILSFYYGLMCGGGFSQVDYLTEMRRAYAKLRAKLSLDDFPEIVTDYFSGEFGLNMGRPYQLSGIDMLLEEKNTAEKMLYENYSNKALADSVDLMVPEFYKIVSDTKIKCEHCGNNPTPHFITWAVESYTILIQPVSMLASKIGLIYPIYWFADKLTQSFARLWLLFGLGKFVGGENIEVGRAKVLWEEAERRGIRMEVLKIFGKTVDFYCAHVNGKKIMFSGLPRPKGADPSALFWMDDKYILKKRLLKSGLPAAKGGSYSSFRKLKKDFDLLYKPVIIKPRLGSRGRHTTTFVYTYDQLRKAYKIAKQLCHWIIMEEHLSGSVYRGTVINGKLVGVLGGDPPRITGDGISNIRQLVEIKNSKRNAKISEIELNDVMLNFLGRSSYTAATILPAGKTIDLSEKIGIAYGGSSYEILDTTHPKIKTALERAAKVVGDPIMGFDFIIQDPAKDPDNQKWGIIECNGMPFIDLHHHPLHGQSINVAKYVWDLFE